MKDLSKQFLHCALLIIACCLSRAAVAQEPASVFEHAVEPTAEAFSNDPLSSTELVPIAEQFQMVEPMVIQESSPQVSGEAGTIDSAEQVDGIEIANPIIECDSNGVPISRCPELGCRFPVGESQSFTVKKSPLPNCMEDIEILPQDEVWLVNARECLCGETDLSQVTVSQFIGNEIAERELPQLTAAHANGDPLVTVLYVHGNMTDEEYAIARGLQVYRNAFAKKAHCRAPVRYVIWAWKSEQEKTRLYPDFLVKSDRSLKVGETFAATLNQFSDRNMIVFGYSLGVQVILSAFDSPILDRREGNPSRYQLAFAAPAINAKFIACNSLASWDTPVEQTHVFTNRKDRAIRAAQAIIRRQNPNEEATIAGLSDTGKLNVGAVTAVDVFGETGRFHSIERYTRSETLQSIMANLVNAVDANKSTASINDAAIIPLEFNNALEVNSEVGATAELEVTGVKDSNNN